MTQGGKHITRNIVTYTLLALLLQGPSKGSRSNGSCISKQEAGKTAYKMLQNSPLGCNDLEEDEARR
jgi:hypothetical protein